LADLFETFFIAEVHFPKRASLFQDKSGYTKDDLKEDYDTTNSIREKQAARQMGLWTETSEANCEDCYVCPVNTIEVSPAYNMRESCSTGQNISHEEYSKHHKSMMTSCELDPVLFSSWASTCPEHVGCMDYEPGRDEIKPC
jgi:hypothetical protein